MLDRGGAKRPVVLGCILAAVGFYLWAGKVTGLSFSAQQWYVVLSGAGVGFMLGPASTDAVNRASRLSYGEATGHHPDGAQLRRQPGPGHPGHAPGHRDALPPDHLPVGAGRAAGPAASEAARLAQSQGGSGSIAVHPPLRTDSTSPTPPAACSTGWPWSWPWPPWSHSSGSEPVSKRSPGRTGWLRSARATPPRPRPEPRSVRSDPAAALPPASRRPISWRRQYAVLRGGPRHRPCRRQPPGAGRLDQEDSHARDPVRAGHRPVGPRHASAGTGTRPW